MCGTISPPILLNRDRRSVMVINPPSSIVAMSPVTYQPSRMTSAVFAGSSNTRACGWGLHEQQAFPAEDRRRP
jgi:hypothetical protein